MPVTDAVELACDWRKASYSVNNGQCVEVASDHAAVLVRDTVTPTGTVIAYAPAAWRAFVSSTKAGGSDTFR
jgi:nitrite reductase/ring-hydroxylating ferredoxin subunit